MPITDGILPGDVYGTKATAVYSPNTGTVALQGGAVSTDNQNPPQPYAPGIVQELINGAIVSNANPMPIAHQAASQVNDPLGNPQSVVQTGFDGVPQAGIPAGSQQLIQPFTPAPTIAANIAIGSQTVTPSAISGTSRGAAWSIQVGSYLIIANSNGTNLEKVRVTAVTPTTFTATFALTKTGPGITIVGEVANQAKDSTIPDGSSPAGVPSGAMFLWNGALNAGVGGLEIERSASGENSGASGAGTNIAAEYEWTSGGPPLANGTPSLLAYDREVAGLGKVLNNTAGAAITSTTAGNTSLTPTTPANFAAITPGSWIRLTGSGTPEYVRVADTYTISATPASIPLTSPVVNTGQTTAFFDVFGANGPQQNPILLTGEGLEGVLLNDPTNPGFGRMWQGDPLGNAKVTYFGGTKATYTYAISATAPYATPTDWIVIRGSSTKTIKITRIEISGAATAATEVIFTLNKHTVANTGGTSTTPTPMQHDSADGAATSTVLLYSAAPTIAGSATIWKSVRMTLAVAPAATTVAPDRYVYDYAAQPYEPLTLRGVSQEFAINFASAAVPSGGVYDVAITITEE